MEETITYHTCSKCGEEKPLTEEYFRKATNNQRGFRANCKECGRKYAREYQRKRVLNNPILLKERREKEKERRKNKEYNDRQKRSNYLSHKRRLQKDPNYRIERQMRSLLKSSFKRKSWTKKSRTYKYLKCDWETFKEHIENQFTEGMSWDNQGEWHLDHIYPISLAQTEEDMFIFNHYTNFQPLWAKDNYEKSNSVPDGFEEWYEMMKEKVSQ